MHEHQSEIWLAIIFAIATALGVEPFVRFARKRGFFAKNIERSPEDIPAESLVEGSIRKANARDLIRAINWGALDLVDSANKPAESSRLEAAWSHSSFTQHAEVAASFITPRCVVAATNGQFAKEKDDALAVLNEWLRGLPRMLHGEIRGDTGVGKTMLLHQLFVDLGKSHSNTVPMLASADNINQNSDELERLKRDGNHISAFVSVWLENRRVVAKTELDEKAIVHAIGKALKNGDIILLLDGVDELKQKGAEDFVTGLLNSVKRWIMTRRYEESARQNSTGNVITLESSWSRGRIIEYARRRLGSRRDTALRVETVLLQVIPEKDTSSHWLSQPSNLRAYIDEVVSSNPPASEPEMHHLAESAMGLMEKLVNRDMRDIKDADPTEIREALAVLALCTPGDPRALRDGPFGQKVGGMKTLLRRDGRSFVFRHLAEAEYFLAVRLADELFNPPSDLNDAEALQKLATKPWGTARIRLVDECLRSMAAATPERADKIAGWLKKSNPPDIDASSRFGPYGKRNLLEVWKKTRFQDALYTGPGAMLNMNLDGIDGQGMDLKGERIESCTFLYADLRDSEMMHAQFIDCQFAEADLKGANAIGASFQRCSFGDGEKFAQVEGFEIEGIEITPPELESKLVSGRARSQRSRYRGKFGEQFLRTQRAFLGRAAEDLEKKSYIPAIQQAIVHALQQRAGEALYLIDLMAGGHGGRSEELLANFPALHILSIDRDAPQRTLSDRHQWMNLEFGEKSLAEPSGTDPFALSALLREAFYDSNGTADVVIAKKALHELDRRLQPALIQSCAAVLRPGGRLVLFVDAPGPETGPVDPSGREAAVQRHEELREILLKPTAQPHEVKRVVNASRYMADLDGEWLFVNDWIAIKDWANLNRHELAHRYFASIAELREWATPWFSEPIEVQIDWYDINPLRFNERGVNWVLHYLERNKEDRETAIKQHRAILAKRLAGSEAFRTLVDITGSVLDRPSGFARMMKAKQSRIQLADVEPLLATLETAEIAPQFELKCGVIAFERHAKLISEGAKEDPLRRIMK